MNDLIIIILIFIKWQTLKRNLLTKFKTKLTIRMLKSYQWCLWRGSTPSGSSSSLATELQTIGNPSQLPVSKQYRSFGASTSTSRDQMNWSPVPRSICLLRAFNRPGRTNRILKVADGKFVSIRVSHLYPTNFGKTWSWVSLASSSLIKTRSMASLFPFEATKIQFQFGTKTGVTRT